MRVYPWLDGEVIQKRFHIGLRESEASCRGGFHHCSCGRNGKRVFGGGAGVGEVFRPRRGGTDCGEENEGSGGSGKMLPHVGWCRRRATRRKAVRAKTRKGGEGKSENLFEEFMLGRERRLGVVARPPGILSNADPSCTGGRTFRGLLSGLSAVMFKMPTLRNFWLLLAVFAAVFETGFSTRCYQCSSRRDPKCADPMSGDLRTTECTRDSVSSTLNEITYAVRGGPGIADVFSGSTFTCLKFNSLNNNHNTTVVRGCSYENMDGRDICTMLGSKIIDQSTFLFCETCNTDACNGSNRLGSTASVASLLLPFIAFYYCFLQ